MKRIPMLLLAASPLCLSNTTVAQVPDMRAQLGAQREAMERPSIMCGCRAYVVFARSEGILNRITQLLRSYCRGRSR